MVVCEDGELYELEMGIDHDSIELTGSWDPVTARKETTKKLDLLPRDYVVYAYNGLMAVTEHLLERQADRGEPAMKRPLRTLLLLALVGAVAAVIVYRWRRRGPGPLWEPEATWRPPTVETPTRTPRPAETTPGATAESHS